MIVMTESVSSPCSHCNGEKGQEGWGTSLARSHKWLNSPFSSDGRGFISKQESGYQLGWGQKKSKFRQ